MPHAYGLKKGYTVRSRKAVHAVIGLWIKQCAMCMVSGRRQARKRGIHRPTNNMIAIIVAQTAAAAAAVRVAKQHLCSQTTRCGVVGIDQWLPKFERATRSVQLELLLSTCLDRSIHTRVSGGLRRPRYFSLMPTCTARRCAHTVQRGAVRLCSKQAFTCSQVCE